MKTTLTTITIAGLIAGTLDGTAAIVQYVAATGGNPTRVFMYIASGVFGQGAFSGGELMAWWGILFHYFIAFSWAAIYIVAYPSVKFFARNKFLSGIVYGPVIWLVMNLIVLPLSNVPPLHPTPFRIFLAIVILMACVGLPIAWIADRHYSGKRTTPEANA